MQCLPEECVPLKGGEGEEHRIQRFIRQMPVHDLTPDVCHTMEDKEKKRMLKFVEKRRMECYGVGTVELEVSEEGKVRTSNVVFLVRIHTTQLWHR